MFLSICKSCFCRWKTRKKAKNQPLIKKKKKIPPKKTHPPKLVSNVSSSVPIIGQTRKEITEFLSLRLLCHEQWHIPGAWEAGAPRLECGMLRETAACGWQCDPRWTWSGWCHLLEPTKVWILAGLPRGNPSELHPNTVEPLVCKRFPNTLGSLCPLDCGFQHRHLP